MYCRLVASMFYEIENCRAVLTRFQYRRKLYIDLPHYVCRCPLMAGIVISIGYVPQARVTGTQLRNDKLAYDL